MSAPATHGGHNYVTVTLCITCMIVPKFWGRKRNKEQWTRFCGWFEASSTNFLCSPY